MVKTNLLNFNEVLKKINNTRELIENLFHTCPSPYIKDRFYELGFENTEDEWQIHLGTIDSTHDCKTELCIRHYPQINRAFTKLGYLKRLAIRYHNNF